MNGTAATGGGSASYDSDGTFTIAARTDYAETQSSTASGLASSTLVRTSASYSSPDVCGSFGSPLTISGNPNQNGLTTGCYRYVLTGTDNVANTVSVSTTVKVDTSDPSAPTFTFSNFVGNTSSVGNVVFFLPTGGGSFDVTASSSDADSGIGQYTFPSAASFGSGWSVSGSGDTRSYSYSPGAATPGSQIVTATNEASGLLPGQSYNGIDGGGIAVSVADALAGLVVLTESGGSTVVSESGQTDTYTVHLAKAPDAGEIVKAQVPLLIGLDRLNSYLQQHKPGPVTIVTVGPKELRLP